LSNPASRCRSASLGRTIDLDGTSHLGTAAFVGWSSISAGITTTAIARIGKLNLASSGLVRGHLGKFGIDLDELLRSVDFPGKIVDIADDEDRVEIFVE